MDLEATLENSETKIDSLNLMLSSEKCGLNGVDLDATLEKSETKNSLNYPRKMLTDWCRFGCNIEEIRSQNRRTVLMLSNEKY